MRTLERVADKLASLMLREESAGACVPNNGYFCGCMLAPDGKSLKRFTINCSGACTWAGTYCPN